MLVCGWSACLVREGKGELSVDACRNSFWVCGKKSPRNKMFEKVLELVFLLDAKLATVCLLRAYSLAYAGFDVGYLR